MTKPESGAKYSILTTLDLEVIKLFADKLTDHAVDEISIDALVESYKEERTPSADTLLLKFEQAVEESEVKEIK